MSRYVDGFLVPMRRSKVPAYRRVAQQAGKVWKEHGALDYCECVGEDLKAPGMMSFRKSARSKPGETVVFSWIVYKSKADRNRVVKKVMKDPRLADMMKPDAMPFDVRRMAYGGFKMIVDL